MNMRRLSLIGFVLGDIGIILTVLTFVISFDPIFRPFAVFLVSWVMDLAMEGVES